MLSIKKKNILNKAERKNVHVIDKTHLQTLMALK